MITERSMSELRHDAEASREIGETMVVRVNCVTLLDLLAEIERHRLAALMYERKQFQTSERD